MSTEYTIPFCPDVVPRTDYLIIPITQFVTNFKSSPPFPSHHWCWLSQVIIFNLKEVQRTTTLDTLAVLQSAANAVTPAESQEVYGHLIVLVRDTFDKADEIYRMLFGEEEPENDATNEDILEVQIRNLTRAKLKNIFKEIKVWCLPQPHADINGENENEALAS